jgi:hypothetical protein
MLEEKNMIEEISLGIAVVSSILLLFVLLKMRKNKKIESIKEIDKPAEKVDVVPEYKGLGKDKKIAIIAVIILILLSVVAVSILIYEEERYSSVQQNYEQLTNTHNSLLIEHNSLLDDYNNLLNQYNDLNEEYASFSETTEQYRQLTIDHLMELTYSKIREECQPNYNPWLGSYYYDSKSVEYAASVCAHDLGRRYWPTIENDYYENKGTHLSHDAHDKIIDLTDVIDVSKYDNDVKKVEKILEFTSSYIEYQYDLNEEYLFPTETLTFRSGDCDDFSILAATLLEEVEIESAIGFFTNQSEDNDHCMILIHLSDLGDYGYYYYDDLTSHGLSTGRWIILEPQVTIENQDAEDLVGRWGMIAVAEIPNE